jgi:hypothetical protein
LLAGSLDSEKGIYAMTFDKSYSRLITTEADKSIKIYREDPESVRTLANYRLALLMSALCLDGRA